MGRAERWDPHRLVLGLVSVSELLMCWAVHSWISHVALIPQFSSQNHRLPWNSSQNITDITFVKSMQLSFLDWKCKKEVYADWNQQNYDQKKIIFCLQKFRKNKIHAQIMGGHTANSNLQCIAVMTKVQWKHRMSFRLACDSLFW